MRGSIIESPDTDTQKEFLGELRYAPRLTRLRHVVALGIGPVIGLILLYPGALEGQLGVSGLAAILIAAFAVALSLLNILELLGGSGGRGGTYGLVFETVGGAPSFLTGWGLVAAQSALVAALLQFVARIWLSAASIAAEPEFVSAVLLIVLVLVQMFQFGRGKGLARGLLLVITLALIITLGLALPGWASSAAQSTSAVEAGLLWRAAARLIVLYLALEAVLASRRQIRARTASVQRGIVLAGLAAAGLAAIVLVASAGIVSPGEGLDLVRSLSRSSGIAVPIVASVVTLPALFTAGTLVLLGARQVNDMSRRGALPPNLRARRRPFVLPPLLFLFVGLLTLAWLVLGQVVTLLDAAAWLLLLPIILVNVAAISSRRSEPERRRTIELPFFPLVPAVAVGLCISLLLNLSGSAQVAGGVWSGLGLVLYAIYARKRQAAAQEGVTLFGSDQQVEKGEDVYRILVPLAPGERHEFLLEAAIALARQLGGDVMPLQVITVADPMAMERGRELARERNQLFRWTTRRLSDAGVPVFPVTRLARTVAEGIVDTVVEEQCDLLLLPWEVDPTEEVDRMGAVIDPVISKSPCDIAVLTVRDDESDGDDEGSGAAREMRKILVPTAGGPHAPLAVGIAWALGREFGSQVVATYVASTDASDYEVQAGESYIRTTLDSMRDRVATALELEGEELSVDLDNIETRVVRADDVVEGILSASEGADMVLIGASEESVIDQVLFGNLPRRIAALCRKPVMMVRRHRGLPRFWLRRIWESLSTTLPTVGREDQIEIYKLVRRGARPDVDFFVMIGLSAVIATFGLLLNSGAVIIGAMLVAPLFTPLLAFSMAIAVGDVRLIRLALESTLKGVVLAVGLALVIAALAPLPIEPLALSEVAGRTRPNLLDLGVALAAGAAGAYAIARKDVAAALPGVAIAAALVPPLGVIGVGLSEGAFVSAGGALLLVTTNLIAISLSGAVTLLLLGFRPAQRSERRARLRMGLTATVILLLLIVIPLGFVLGQGVERATTELTVQSVLEAELSDQPGLRLAELEVVEQDRSLTVTASVHVLDGARGLDGEELRAVLEDAVDRPITLRLMPVPIQEFRAP